MIVSAVAQLASIGILFKVTSIRGLYFGIILLSIGMGIGVSRILIICLFHLDTCTCEERLLFYA